MIERSVYLLSASHGWTNRDLEEVSTACAHISLSKGSNLQADVLNSCKAPRSLGASFQPLPFVGPVQEASNYTAFAVNEEQVLAV